MPAIGSKVPDRWVPTHRSEDRNRTLYLDFMGGMWYFAELGIIRAIYPDTRIGRNVVTVALIKGFEGVTRELELKLERLKDAA